MFLPQYFNLLRPCVFIWRHYILGLHFVLICTYFFVPPRDRKSTLECHVNTMLLSLHFSVERSFSSTNLKWFSPHIRIFSSPWNKEVKCAEETAMFLITKGARADVTSHGCHELYSLIMLFPQPITENFYNKLSNF